MEFLEALNQFLNNQGTVKGLLILAIFYFVWDNNRKQRELLASKDQEIRRMADDLHDMRDRMMVLWDKRNGRADETEEGEKQ